MKTLFSRHRRHRQQRPTKFSACSKQRQHRRVSGRVPRARHSRTVNRPRRRDSGVRTRNETNSDQHNNNNNNTNNINSIINIKISAAKNTPRVINKLPVNGTRDGGGPSATDGDDGASANRRTRNERVRSPHHDDYFCCTTTTTGLRLYVTARGTAKRYIIIIIIIIMVFYLTDPPRRHRPRKVRRRGEKEVKSLPPPDGVLASPSECRASGDLPNLT